PNIVIPPACTTVQASCFRSAGRRLRPLLAIFEIGAAIRARTVGGLREGPVAPERKAPSPRAVLAIGKDIDFERRPAAHFTGEFEAEGRQNGTIGTERPKHT